MEAQRFISNWAAWVLLGLTISAHLVIVADSTIQCTDALIKMEPCQQFVFGQGPDMPSPQCCAGASELEKIVARSKSDKKALCECLKQAASNLPDSDKANQLPKLCHLTMNITISPDLDCDKL